MIPCHCNRLGCFVIVSQVTLHGVASETMRYVQGVDKKVMVHETANAANNYVVVYRRTSVAVITASVTIIHGYINGAVSCIDIRRA
jgi:hypothetical protein